MNLSPEIKNMLEIITGKSYEKIILADLDKIDPIINKELYKQAAEFVADFLL